MSFEQANTNISNALGNANNPESAYESLGPGLELLATATLAALQELDNKIAALGKSKSVATSHFTNASGYFANIAPNSKKSDVIVKDLANGLLMLSNGLNFTLTGMVKNLSA